MQRRWFERRDSRGVACLVLVVAGLFGARALFAGDALAAKLPLAEAVESIGIVVSDLDRSVEFFSKELTFEKVSDAEYAGSELEHLEGVFGLRVRTARLKLGDELLDLTEYLAPAGRAVPVDSRSNDLWFQHIAIVVRDMDSAYARLRRRKVAHASSGPQRLPDWNKNAGGIKAFYFKDPDGHVLEILEFPAGKGDPKWQKPSEKLFLGIDHTAITVSDTEASLRFYRDSLGLRVAGESENYGTEQEHLNNVFGARVRITALRAAKGPGIELLEYIAPGGGRAPPLDTRSCDLIAWQTRLMTRQTDAVGEALRARRYQLVSTGVVALDGLALGFAKALVTKDPDGHAVKIVERSPLTASERP